MSYEQHHATAPTSVGVAVLTVSDTKGPATDQSGDTILKALRDAHHRPAGRDWAHDDPAEIREKMDELIEAPDADALIVTGGTGVSTRDVTIEAIAPRFAKELPGFGERFRALSAESIGSGALLSRATAGLVLVGSRHKPVFLLPGAPEACELAVTRLIAPEVGHLVELANPKKRIHV